MLGGRVGGREVCLVHDLLYVGEERVRVLVPGAGHQVRQRQLWGRHAGHGPHGEKPGRHHPQLRGETGWSSGSHGVLEDESLGERVKEGIRPRSDHLGPLVSLPPPQE